MKIIAGGEIATSLRLQVAKDVNLLGEHGIDPTLAVVLVGEDPASKIYVRRKLEQSEVVGIRSIEHRLSSDYSEIALLDLIDGLNTDPGVHGILVQLPLPPQIDVVKILDAIHPAKDVDGFHPLNVGRLSGGGPSFIPCTPLSCILLLESVISDFRGRTAVVIGRSNIVGKPVAQLLLQKGCTVTVAHSLTRDLPSVVRGADIVVVAVGRPSLVKGSWVKPGAVVIDVGINRIEGEGGKSKIVGDVAFYEMEHAGAVTPVPGGVGPMTIACLLANTVTAARASVLA